MSLSSSASLSAQLQQDPRPREILSAQIQLLYANLELGVGITAFATTLLSLLQWPTVPHRVVAGWWTYMILLSAARYVLARRFKQIPPSQEEVKKWQTAFTVCAGLAGVGWGGAGILLYPPAQMINQVFLVFVLGGMMLGAASQLAPRPEAFLAFLTPAGLGPALRLTLQGDWTHVGMGLLAALFTLATVVTTWRIYRTIDSSLRLKFENRDLLEELRAAKNQADALNEELELKVHERTAELRNSTEHLREEIAERKQVEAELLRAQRALLDSEKLAATARLAATMAHEINNPLAAITNLMFLLDPLQTSPEAKAYIATLEEQVTGLSRIATQMLKFHRDSNRPTEFKLSAVVSEVSEFYRPQAEQRGIVVDRRIESDGMFVGYKGEIVQVITNLLLNALEATSLRGKISIHLYPAPPWLCELYRRCGYCICVADNGRGIGPEDRARIFEPFFTTKGDRGTGLGLWVCKGIVNRAGGMMRVWSSHRSSFSGTCFWVFLPANSTQYMPHRRRYDEDVQLQKEAV